MEENSNKFLFPLFLLKEFNYKSGRGQENNI